MITTECTRADEDTVLLYDGLHEAIIDEDLFYRTQNYLKNNKPKPAPDKKPIKNPLSSIVICGQCGSKMVRRPYPSRTPDALICPQSGCNNISSYLSYVENRILVSLQQWLTNYKLQLSIETKESISNTEIEVKEQNIRRLEKEIKNLNKQLNNIHDFLEQGIYLTETFIESSKIINNKLTELKADLKVLNKEF